MKNKTESVTKKIAAVAAGTAAVAAAVAAGATVVDFVQSGLDESASIRVAEANTCAPNQDGEPSFAGCSSII